MGILHICGVLYMTNKQTGRKGRAFRRGASVGQSNQKRVLTTSKGINCRDVLHNAAPYLTHDKL